MTQTAPKSTATYTGVFDAAAYEIARAILAADNERAKAQMKAELNRRRNIVVAVVAAWIIVSVIVAFTNANLLLGVEVVWAIIVFASVFWLFPTVVGNANLDDIYDQYAAQLDKLERAQAPLPEPSCIEDLVAAIDFATDELQDTPEQR